MNLTHQMTGAFSLNLHLKNEVPVTIAKKSLTRQRKLEQKASNCKGKRKNMLLGLRKKWPKTSWPSSYWVLIPVKCPKARKKIWVEHPFKLPHEWVALYMQDAGVLARSQPAKGSKVVNALQFGAGNRPAHEWSVE